MTLKAKFSQLTSMLQDMEHSLKLNLNAKPSLSEVEILVKNEIGALYDNLKADINNLVKQQRAEDPQGSKDPQSAEDPQRAEDPSVECKQ